MTVPQPDATDGFYERVYAETRSDVRAFSSLLFQAITLFLTTLMIIVGWGAKDFVLEKYRLAAGTAAPLIAEDRRCENTTQMATEKATAPRSSSNQVFEDEARALSDRFYSSLARSPVTSLILLALGIFVSTLVCTIVVLGYVVDNRRQYSHVLAHQMGTPDRETEPSSKLHKALTSTAVNLFAGFILAVAVVLLLGGLAQTAYVLKTVSLPRSLEAILYVAMALALYKVGSSIYLAGGYSRWARRMGWRVRWRRAQPILDEMSGDSGIASAGPEVASALEALKRRAHLSGPAWFERRIVAGAITDLWKALTGAGVGDAWQCRLERLAQVLHSERHVDWRTCATHE